MVGWIWCLAWTSIIELQHWCIFETKTFSKRRATNHAQHSPRHGRNVCRSFSTVAARHGRVASNATLPKTRNRDVLGPGWGQVHQTLWALGPSWKDQRQSCGIVMNWLIFGIVPLGNNSRLQETQGRKPLRPFRTWAGQRSVQAVWGCKTGKLVETTPKITTSGKFYQKT